MESSEGENENETKAKKECLFGFAKLNKYFIIPFICPIISMACNYLINDIIDAIGFENREFLLISYVEITYIGGGVVYFISWIRTKTEETRDKANIYKEKERSTSSTITYIYNEGLKVNQCKIFGIIFFISVIIALFTVCDIYAINYNIFEERLYFLFFTCIFSKLILKDDIFRHQILSLIIASVGLILLFIPVMLVITKDDIIVNICIFILSIGYALFLVLVKYLMMKYFISPYLCTLIIGVFSTLLNIIGFIGYSLIKKGNLSIITDSFDFKNVSNKTKISIYFSILFILASILQTLSNLVIYYFTPTLLMVTDSIGPMLFWMVYVLPKGEKKIDIIFKFLGYSISLFSTLIYNEIIILNFGGLNENTKKYIEQRQKKELISLRNTEIEAKDPNLNHENETSEEENEDDKSNSD